MGKNKLSKFEENLSFKNLVQPAFDDVFRHDHELKGNWHEKMFGNTNPLVLELGCGKGEYTVGLSRYFKDKNFLGIDIKGARMWRGAKTTNEEKITNAAFLRTRIEVINSFFAKDEVSEIWITFPDPQLKTGRIKKRLTASGFLNNYRTFLKPGGIVHLKTDNVNLHRYTKALAEENGLEILLVTEDLYGTVSNDPILGIRTYYESMFLEKGMTITYLRFKIDGSKPLVEPTQFEEQFL